LRQWLAEGRVNSQTQVLPEGATEWKRLVDLPEFAGASPAPAPVAAASPTVTVAAAQLVKGPAIGLIVTAVLGALVQIASLIMHLAGATFPAHNEMPNQAWVSFMSGTVGAIASVIGLIVSVVILLGALKMQKLQNYGFAMAASIIAMIPCFSPCCLLGLPIGIWAIIVLSKPEVKSAFH
jgi:hypothetical protein